MYTCGPTVYDYAHVGNFRAFLTYDLIKRALLYMGYDVTHICNLTDVDDKIIQRANEQDITKVQDLTRRYEDYFFQDLKALNVVLADRYPRATEHIPEMMDMILELAAKDLAYETEDGSWYFATANKEGYGEQLVQLQVEDMETTERGESDMKRDPQDFALWKAFKPGVDREDSSWERPGQIQKGRPGWHLECSAMARKYLGDTIDIHGGGIDLKFPHHENEIAQSEGVSGKTFCNCWLHNGFVNINDEKMSKSLGNFLTLRGACPQSKDVRAYRFLVMSSQYSKQLSFTPEAMSAAKNSLKRIDKVMTQIENVLKEEVANQQPVDKEPSKIAEKEVPEALANFEAALLDDLSMPRASAALFSVIKAAEQEFKRASKAEEGSEDARLDIVGLRSIEAALRQMDRIFGIFYEVPLTKEEQQASKQSDAQDSGAVPEEVMDLVMQRAEAKEAKDWELADSLRARITELGFAVKDVKGGVPVVTRVEV
jgi:cysteinyl-tRNA synthetase